MYQKIEKVHSGHYVAVVEVNLIESDNEWALYLSVEDATRPVDDL